MIDLYFWTTPNGYKPLILLEEAGFDYAVRPVNIGTGEQFEPDFLRISPNNRIPAIVDYDVADGPVSLFESGAILQYLAEKAGKFLPGIGAERAEVLQWLHWQMGGVGPMFGQYHHFVDFADMDIPYAKNRYTSEVERLLGVLDRQLAGNEFVAGDYSIADMAIYPWVRGDLERFDGLKNARRWASTIAHRPATIRAYEIGRSVNTATLVTENSKALLFGSVNGKAA